MRHSPTSRRRYRRDRRVRARQFLIFRAAQYFANIAAPVSARLRRRLIHRPKRKCGRGPRGRISREFAREPFDRLVRAPASKTCSRVRACSAIAVSNLRMRVPVKIHPPRRNRVENAPAICGVKPRPFGASDLQRRRIFTDSRKWMPDFERLLRIRRSSRLLRSRHVAEIAARRKIFASKFAENISSNAARFNFLRACGISPITRARP